MNMARLLLLAAGLAAGACGTIGGPRSALASSTPTSSAAALDPDVALQLRLNNASFQLLASPAPGSISEDDAVAAVLEQVTGTVGARRVQFGRLHAPLLGARSDRDAWLVILDGVAPPRPSGGAPPTGSIRTAAFVDAQDGRGLFMFATGAGPAR